MVQTFHFAFIVVNFFLLHNLKLLTSGFILLLESLGLFEDEIAKQIKPVLLLDGFSLEDFGHLG